MYLRAEITTSCRSAGTRYTRLNLLGWAMLCPHALTLLLHGGEPFTRFDYPTADESRISHHRLQATVHNIIKNLIKRKIITARVEYDHSIEITIEGIRLCARSRADLVYIIQYRGKFVTIYVEISSTRINVAKPYQTILRAIGLYYQYRHPVIIIMVSPSEIRYKILSAKDQERIVQILHKRAKQTKVHQNLCSLCELAQYCPNRTI